MYKHVELLLLLYGYFQYSLHKCPNYLKHELYKPIRFFNRGNIFISLASLNLKENKQAEAPVVGISGNIANKVNM